MFFWTMQVSIPRRRARFMVRLAETSTEERHPGQLIHAMVFFSRDGLILYNAASGGRAAQLFILHPK